MGAIRESNVKKTSNITQYVSTVRTALEKLNLSTEYSQSQIKDGYSDFNNPRSKIRKADDGLFGLSLGRYLATDGSIKHHSAPYKEAAKEDDQPINDPLYYVCKKYIQLSNSARKRGLDFDLSLYDIRKLIDTEKCYYTGVKLTTPVHLELTQLDRTVDRKDPNKGYVKGNVVACCHMANQFKAKIEYEFDEIANRKQVCKIVHKMFCDRRFPYALL